MAYTVNQLVSGAFYASGIVSREFETVSGQQLFDGIEWLNEILAEKTIDSDMVPYESTYELNLVQGQEEYYIEDLIEIDTLTFTIDSVRFPVQQTPRDQYFGSVRVNNIQSLPVCWFMEREYGGARLYIYFQPNSSYVAEIKGIFRLNNVTQGQDLSLTLDQFYITYLKYALACKICDEYSMEIPRGVLKQHDKYYGYISKKSRPLDLHIRKSSTLHKRNGGSWAWANLFRGYTT